MHTYIVFFLCLILAGCSTEQPEANNKIAQPEPPLATQILFDQNQAPFTSITAYMAQKLIADKADLLILDTRTTREILSYGAIPGSRQTSLRAVFQDELAIPKDTPILVVCAVGGRSYAAGQIMVKHGFTEIYNLRGGLDKWKEAGLPVAYPQK